MCSRTGTSRSSMSVASVVSGMVLLLGQPRGSATGLGVLMGGLTASRLQVPVDEVDLLEAPKPLADVLGADLPHALHRLQLCVRRRQHLVEPPELLDDLLDDELRKPRDAPEDPVAPRGHGVVKGVDLAVVAEQLGEAAEVQEVLVRQSPERVERAGEGVVAVLGEVVVD